MSPSFGLPHRASVTQRRNRWAERVVTQSVGMRTMSGGIRAWVSPGYLIASGAPRPADTILVVFQPGAHLLGRPHRDGALVPAAERAGHQVGGRLPARQPSPGAGRDRRGQPLGHPGGLLHRSLPRGRLGRSARVDGSGGTARTLLRHLVPPVCPPLAVITLPGRNAGSERTRRIDHLPGATGADTRRKRHRGGSTLYRPAPARVRAAILERDAPAVDEAGVGRVHVTDLQPPGAVLQLAGQVRRVGG